MTTTKQDLWELASVIAFARLGLVPLGRVEGRLVPPRRALESMPPDEARKAKRKYRKLWRRSLARELKAFEQLPRRMKLQLFAWHGAYVRGKWKSSEDLLEGQMIVIEASEVGQHPSRWARGYRWQRVRHSDEYVRELTIAARELGLLPRWVMNYTTM